MRRRSHPVSRAPLRAGGAVPIASNGYGEEAAPPAFNRTSTIEEMDL
jgi:hypothetical protein